MSDTSQRARSLFTSSVTARVACKLKSAMKWMSFSTHRKGKMAESSYRGSGLKTSSCGKRSKRHTTKDEGSKATSSARSKVDLRLTSAFRDSSRDRTWTSAP